MRILFVAFGFPPARASGVYRAVAIARRLAACDHDVTILTADAEYFGISTGIDPSLTATLPPNLRTVRAPYADLRDPILNRWPKARVTDPIAWRRATEAYRDQLFPDRGAGWRDRIVGTAVRLHRRDPFDFVVATGNPYASYAVPQALNITEGVPYLIDDRDSFVFSVYTGEPQPEFERRAAWWRTLAEGAEEMWFVNPPIANLYRRMFPHLSAKIHVVENGWDSTYLNPQDIVPRTASPPIFGYVGTLNVEFPLAALLKGWADARGTDIPADSRLHFIGHVGYYEQSADQRELLRSHEKLGVRLIGPVPKPRIREAYERCNVLLFTREGGGLVTSGKIYEYVATGMPVAGVVPADHDSRRVFGSYPRQHVLPDTAERAWPRSLAAALADSRRADPATVAAARSYGARYERDELLGAALDRALSRHSRGPASH